MTGVLEGKVALVTGAGSGIGRASAMALAAAGARVAIVDQDIEGAEETVDLAGGSRHAVAIAADVTDRADTERMVAETLDAFGGLDIAHNNAGIDLVGPDLTQTSTEQWAKVIDVNLTGVWLCMRSEIPVMVEAGGGSVVNTASALGLAAIPNQGAYIAAKHGVIGLTRAAATEFGGAGVRVNAICPGPVLTPLFEKVLNESPGLADTLLPLHPLGRFGKPGEIADSVVWLGSEGSSYVTGTAVPVDGGFLAG